MLFSNPSTNKGAIVPFLKNSLILSILGTLTFFSNQTLACTDGTFYMQCQNQMPIFASALQKAKQTRKTLVVTMGYESCPWCQSLAKMFNDFHSQQGNIDAQFVFVDIAVYSYDRISKKFAEVPSGMTLGHQLISRLATPATVSGFPVIFVVNPRTGKASMIETGRLEDNDEARGVYGHSQQKVIETLYQARGDTLSVE
jgi:thioredoxin-related protein